MPEYLVPRAVRSRMEVFPGFGLVEILAVAAGGAVGAVLQLIPAALPLTPAPQLFARFFAFTLPLGVAYVLVRQDLGGHSLWGQLQAFRRWANHPRIYYYRRGDV